MLIDKINDEFWFLEALTDPTYYDRKWKEFKEAEEAKKSDRNDWDLPLDAFVH